MHRVLKEVFLMLLCCTVALILYFIFFGVNLAPYGTWEGLISYSARAVETPIARYYYEYCYLPNIHANDSIDEALGGTSTVSNLFQTPADLSSSGTDTVSFHSVVPYYTTGWR